MTAVSTAPLNVSDARGRLEQAPAIASALCGGWPDALWDVDEGRGTWSARAVLCHLLHGEDEDWIPRMRQILDGRGREPFPVFDREKGMRTYGQEPPARLLDLFARKRAASLEAFDRWHVGERTLLETGTHPEFGAVTFEQLLATWVTHDFAHIVQIARVAARHYGRHAGPWRAYFSLLRGQ